MKTLFVLVALVAVVAVNAHPHPEYAVVQEDGGSLKLEDLNQEPVPEVFFDAVSDVRYFLFTRSNRGNAQELFGNADSITGSNFNPAHPTRVLIHGWRGNAASEVNLVIRDAYLNRGDFNVIVVDWAVGADTTLYQTARNRVGAVGGAVAYFLFDVINFGLARSSDMTVIGHNLGAHIAGMTGKNFIGDRVLGNVVALDAAMNGFSIDAPTQRVSSGDANYVESIHTNTGQNGFEQPLGDASFYPNFGSRQPGCGIDMSGNCAHARSIFLFAESVTTTRHFWSRQCSAYKDILLEQCTAIGVDRKMGGEPVDNLARGIYWLTTNSNSPFSTGVL